LYDSISLSGGDDDAHGNQTEFEAALNAGNAIWEITRYSGVVHGFTKWDAADAYSLKADVRSWESMMTTFEQLLPVPVRLLDGEVEAPTDALAGSDSPSSVPNQSPDVPVGPTVSPLQSGAPSSIPTIMPNNATVPELPQPTDMPTTVVPTSTASSQQLSFIATASLLLCILWTGFS
jgi:Dienelactone hydrolase family